MTDFTFWGITSQGMKNHITKYEQTRLLMSICDLAKMKCADVKEAEIVFSMLKKVRRFSV